MLDRTDQDSSAIICSVIVPTLDRTDALRACLRALSAQTFDSFEVLVVDDGSSEDIAAVAGEFAGSLEIRVVRNEQNLGANKSRNRGVREARGEYVAFLDSDCVAAADWLEALVRAAGDADAAAATGRIDYPDPENLFELAYSGTNRLPQGKNASSLRGGNLLARRDVLLDEPFDEDLKYGCDEEGLFLRLRGAGAKQIFVPGAVVTHVHRFDGRRYFRYAHTSGRGAAWFVYKYRLWPRLDVALFALPWLLLPLVLVDARLGVIPAGMLVLALLAALYNEVGRKGKGVLRALPVLPVLLVYYQFRVAGYVRQSLSLYFRSHDIRRLDRRLGGRAA